MKKDFNPAISKELLKAFCQFVEQHPAKRISRNLRKVFMAFLESSLNVMPINLDDIIWDIECLMELLDAIEDHETNKAS